MDRLLGVARGRSRSAGRAARLLLLSLGALLAGCEDDGSVNRGSPEAQKEWAARIEAAHAHAARKAAPSAEAEAEPASPESAARTTEPNAPLANAPLASAQARAHAPRSHRRPGRSDGKATTPSMLVRDVVSDPGGPKIVEIRPANAVARIRGR